MDGDEARPRADHTGTASAAEVPRPAEPALSISAVERQTGIPQATLRAWQHRYGLGPSRVTIGGHRRYTADDVARLRAVQHLIGTGIPAGEAARSVLGAAADGVPRLELPSDAGRAAQRLAAAALDLDGPTVRALLREHLAGHGVLDTWENALRPVLAAIGEQWPGVEAGIAAEHLLSHIAAIALGETVRRPPGSADRAVVLACVPGEPHDLPLHALSAALDVTRAEATLLGARTPAETLLAAVRRTRPDLVLVFALLAEPADVVLVRELAEEVTVVAAGPGWDTALLPSQVTHVDDLLAATEAVTTLP